MKHYGQHRQVGFTLTELLVVLVIISILATIAMPVYVNQAEKARVSAARAECKLIAEAEDYVGALYGFYVPLQLLDDLPGIRGTNGVGSNADAIRSEVSSIALVDLNRDLLDLGTAQPTLGMYATNARVSNLLYNWDGPFLSAQRVYYEGTGAIETATPGEAARDYPLDPWGNPYRFYSPIGIIGSGALSSTYNSSNFSDGQIQQGVDDRFDHYAVVSFGSDGESDKYAGNTSDPNDIIYLFGKVNVPSETNYSLF